MPGVAANEIAHPRRVRRWFGLGLIAVLVVTLLLCGDSNRKAIAARTGFVLAKGCQHALAPPVPASPADQRDTFIRTLAEAIRFSGLAAVAPPILPQGTIIQGYDVPNTQGVRTVVVDITRSCDLDAPRVIQIHESDTNPSLPPSISAEFERLTLGGKHVGRITGSQADIYAWDGKELSFWLTVENKRAVSQEQVEQLIAVMP